MIRALAFAIGVLAQQPPAALQPQALPILAALQPSIDPPPPEPPPPPPAPVAPPPPPPPLDPLPDDPFAPLTIALNEGPTVFPEDAAKQAPEPAPPSLPVEPNPPSTQLQASAARWYRLTNLPGLEGWGELENGFVIVEKWRQEGTTEEHAGEPRAPTVAQPQQSGFLFRLNQIRAGQRLRALVEDAALAQQAMQNCVIQLRMRRSGHYAGGGYEVAFYGPSDEISALNGWLASPGHASILLNPSLTRIGLANVANSWTAQLR